MAYFYDQPQHKAVPRPPQLQTPRPPGARGCHPDQLCVWQVPNFRIVGRLVNSRRSGSAAGSMRYPTSLRNHRAPDCECERTRCCVQCGSVHDSLESDDGGDLEEDKRLAAWMRMLDERQRIAKRISERTGKMPCQLLFNRPSVDERDKLLIKRLIEQADTVTGDRAGMDRFAELALTEAPAAGSSGGGGGYTTVVEVSGMPRMTRQEVYGTDCCCVGTRWIDSAAVHESIANRKENIHRLVPFFPDIELLQVIGTRATLHMARPGEYVEESDEVCCCASMISTRSNKSLFCHVLAQTGPVACVDDDGDPCVGLCDVDSTSGTAEPWCCDDRFDPLDVSFTMGRTELDALAKLDVCPPRRVSRRLCEPRHRCCAGSCEIQRPFDDEGEDDGDGNGDDGNGDGDGESPSNFQSEEEDQNSNNKNLPAFNSGELESEEVLMMDKNIQSSLDDSEWTAELLRDARRLSDERRYRASSFRYPSIIYTGSMPEDIMDPAGSIKRVSAGSIKRVSTGSIKRVSAHLPGRSSLTSVKFDEGNDPDTAEPMRPIDSDVSYNDTLKSRLSSTVSPGEMSPMPSPVASPNAQSVSSRKSWNGAASQSWLSQQSVDDAVKRKTQSIPDTNTASVSPRLKSDDGSLLPITATFMVQTTNSLASQADKLSVVSAPTSNGPNIPAERSQNSVASQADSSRKSEAPLESTLASKLHNITNKRSTLSVTSQAISNKPALSENPLAATTIVQSVAVRKSVNSVASQADSDNSKFGLPAIGIDPTKVTSKASEPENVWLQPQSLNATNPTESTILPYIFNGSLQVETTTNREIVLAPSQKRDVSVQYMAADREMPKQSLRKSLQSRMSLVPRKRTTKAQLPKAKPKVTSTAVVKSCPAARQQRSSLVRKPCTCCSRCSGSPAKVVRTSSAAVSKTPSTNSNKENNEPTQ